MTGVEAGGEGIIDGKHAAGSRGRTWRATGHALVCPFRTKMGKFNYPQVSAGLDYAAVGPSTPGCATRTGSIHLRHRQGGAGGIPQLAKLEGIIPALEPSHAIAEVIKTAPKMSSDKIIIVNLSGRGDKESHKSPRWESSNAWPSAWLIHDERARENPGGQMVVCRAPVQDPWPSG
ncbi:MAG: hypothetical protein Ct9H300mP32_0710 [Verrucomicrobiota bacterium]|nr:MAG: hypothetical protein Ct9H300mP32_0710 [Verrucomicrobiota bacterium]